MSGVPTEEMRGYLSLCKNPPADCLSVFQSVQVPWEDLCYLFGEIMYGGHITDDWDRRLCKTYLQEFMHPRMVSRRVSAASVESDNCRTASVYDPSHPSPKWFGKSSPRIVAKGRVSSTNQEVCVTLPR